MALTQGAWVEKSVNGQYVAYCDVTSTVAEYIHATLKSPKGLDTTKPYLLVVNSESATLDDTSAVIPVDVYAGYSEDFALSVTTSTLTVTDGALIANDMIADVRTAIGAVIVDPNLQIANAAGVVCRGAAAGYHGYTATAASVLSAETCRFVVMQASEGNDGSLSISGVGSDPS